jgi:predicted flap endonuclease-1-like 5' DNA nuclease
MNHLLLQTFLLLLASYFIGAFLACLVKRAVAGMNTAEPAHVPIAAVVEPSIPPPVTLAPPPVRPRLPPPVRPPATPRPIDPVQPRIDVLRRPEPRKLPKLVDPGRFERALMGPDPNEGIPRKAIAEIRPKVLKSPTGPIRPRSPTPVVQPETPPPIAEPATATAAIAAADKARPATPSPSTSSVSVPSIAKTNTDAAPARRSLSDATTSAAATAVAAAKAAAAASIGVFSRSTSTEAKPAPDKEPEKVSDVDPIPAPDPTPVAAASDTKTSPEIKTSAEIKPAEKAPAVAKPPIEGGDDLQRIRAIDVEAEQKLKGLGVNYFEHIATWTSSDIKRIGQALGIPGRIDREQWVEQAQILAKGGETYYSRNRLAALKANTPAPQVDTDTSSAEPQGAASSSDETAASATPAKQAGTQKSALTGVAAVSHGRSVAEMASAAAAAIAAASASVTRGLKPIEPISPLSRVDPKISLPARLSDAIRERMAASVAAQVDTDSPTTEKSEPKSAPAKEGHVDDLKRIRGIGVLIEKRLNAMGVISYEHIANWTSGDIDRVSQVLEFGGRIERESWVEQARILSSGGQTEFSRRVDRGEFDTSRET